MKVLNECNLAQLVVDILDGKTVVFPTETSYGLGCDATNQQAVDKIFKIKQRDANKPLLVVVPSVQMAREYLVWNDLLEKIAKKYWPGAVTVAGEARPHPALPFLEGEEMTARPHPALPFLEGEDMTARPHPNPPLFVRGGSSNPLLSKRRGQGAVSVFRDRVVGFLRTVDFRRQLRKDATKAEELLWDNLKSKKLGGLKFRRQHGIGPFIVDFFHPETRTVIEVDGDIHFALDKQVKKDLVREQWLKERNYKIMRFNNVDIFNNLEWILEEIYYNLSEARPHPALPFLEGEEMTARPHPALPFLEGEEMTARPHPNPPLFVRGGGLATGVVSPEGTIALRVTAHPLLKSITEEIGRPLVATSANISEAGDMYDAKKIVEQFSNAKNKPDIILNYGVLSKIRPSTLVSVVGNELKVLRQGEVKVS